ncbi:solute carrier organic anion transporter family member 2B1 isoform X1 [Aquarana catesbeiana]|uniref:solute carrier organic anion transporter family member 2B1 isoform X1 n=2 Tax=Aquarana catesbeiana TaxID=8400 RepID=UPI003CCA66E2
MVRECAGGGRNQDTNTKGKMTAGGQNNYAGPQTKKTASCRNPFNNIKVFMFCHGLLQLSQLLLTGYLRSTISTIEKRFGVSSQTSGILSSFNEIGNTILIVFVSYFGSRVHRPRFIGFGALVVCVAGFIMCLPHFIMGQYEYDKSHASVYSNITDVCQPDISNLDDSNDQCVIKMDKENRNVLSILFIGQILLGIGGVPIQPFGISYIDDYASKRNSPLYIGILFAMTIMGPGVAFILGSAMLRYYVDIDKIPANEIVLTPSDPRWIGAWWMGYIVAASVVAIASVPYFFFPREMPQEQVTSEGAEDSKPGLMDAIKNKPDPKEQVSLAEFIKVFPKVLLRTLKNPVYFLVVMAQANLSAMVCGLATFMAKFLERQFTITASFANLMIGSVNIPGAMAGIVVGGVIMKRFQLSPRQCGAMCVICMLCCILLALPLLFLGCSTQQFASPNADPNLSGGLWHNVSECSSHCGCSSTAFNPICGSDGTEYISPCYAGCEVVSFDEANKVMNYTRCHCITAEGSGGTATPGTCGTRCQHLFLPFMVLSFLAGTLASTAQTPSFMLILRSVRPADKSLAIGIQFMLLRILAWLPGPVMYGSMIDSTCIQWGKRCGSKAACQYYNNNLLRQRFIGLQILFEIVALILFIALYFVIRHKDNVPQEAEKDPESHTLNEKKATVKI